MVSQWCDNGTLCEYLKRNPDADRLTLVLLLLTLCYFWALTFGSYQLTQVASGIAYLHTVKPTIIHGDLKGVCTAPTTFG